ncbi:MAG TPA: hypothetical protein VGM90_13320 [Kofleriaceae bacterium]
MTVLAALASSLGACGHDTAKKDTYAKSTEVQEGCCEHLAGDARAQCLQGIIRVGDADVAKSSVNQEQYACVADHFTCDPTAGHATKASAQAQMDCLQALK